MSFRGQRSDRGNPFPACWILRIADTSLRTGLAMTAQKFLTLRWPECRPDGTMMYSTSSRVILVPAYLSVMTLSPGFTVMVTGLPSTSAAGAYGDDFRHRGLLLGGAGEDDAALGGLLSLRHLQNDAISKAVSVSWFFPPYILILINKFSVSTQNTGVLTLIIIPHL